MGGERERESHRFKSLGGGMGRQRWREGYNRLSCRNNKSRCVVKMQHSLKQTTTTQHDGKRTDCSKPEKIPSRVHHRCKFPSVVVVVVVVVAAAVLLMYPLRQRIGQQVDDDDDDDDDDGIVVLLVVEVLLLGGCGSEMPPWMTTLFPSMSEAQKQNLVDKSIFHSYREREIISHVLVVSPHVSV